MNSTLTQSISIHGAIAGLFAILVWLQGFQSSPEIVTVPITSPPPIEDQKLQKIEERKQVVLKSVNQVKKKKASAKKKARAVYGASRKSLLTEDTTEKKSAISFKKGNTLAKEVDAKVLKDSDPDSLPVPTEEYLVSQMPEVLREVRPSYPKQAREERIEGAVVLSVLIDQNGTVRDVAVVDGPEIFRGPAVEAMKSFKFKPAIMDGQSVAVRIRYTLRFILES